MARSIGAIDIHFHGAFGIDLMSATPAALDSLSDQLWENGVAGFCATTLSTDPNELAGAVARIGEWIQGYRGKGALPLGIHLEGPFINHACCGAHPPELIRKLDFEELERLWQLSRKTLRILTIAPEILSSEELKNLCRWAASRKISLSLGHSKATEEQARHAFLGGFRGVTHAWNALGFHQRSPGPLGAVLGNPKAYVEIIIDRVHVAPTVIRWTESLHPRERLCFISDCVPAAETSGEQTYSFGPLHIRYQDGACRLPNGALAGGGKLLSRSFCEWLELNSKTPVELKTQLRKALPSLTTAPLWALQIPVRKLASRQVTWSLEGGKLRVSPTY